jgi:hypothetical protein
VVGEHVVRRFIEVTKGAAPEAAIDGGATRQTFAL